MPVVAEIDAFDLCDWLGTEEVTWSATGSVRAGHRVEGSLMTAGHAESCDLLAVDEAYPRPVIGEDWRARSHRAWTHEQVLLLRLDGRITVAVPGTSFTADRVLEVVARLAKAVGATPERFTVTLRP